jgi:hypothetical protein
MPEDLLSLMAIEALKITFEIKRVFIRRNVCTVNLLAGKEGCQSAWRYVNSGTHQANPRLLRVAFLPLVPFFYLDRARCVYRKMKFLGSSQWRTRRLRAAVRGTVSSRCGMSKPEVRQPVSLSTPQASREENSFG